MYLAFVLMSFPCVLCLDIKKWIHLDYFTKHVPTDPNPKHQQQKSQSTGDFVWQALFYFRRASMRSPQLIQFHQGMRQRMKSEK